MRPIAIFRHLAIEGPGYLAEFLDARAIPWTLIAVDAGAQVPNDPHDFAGLVFMGGPMSVNDDLPWISGSLDLIRQAVAADIPVLGHCLGGQLMAKALGGTVTRNPVKEIGWGAVTVADTDSARAWFGDVTEFEAFHWHGETFSLPPAAELLLSSPYCAHQAFTLGKHLALQCHVEMTEAMIAEWCAYGASEIEASDSPAVSSADAIVAHSAANLMEMRLVAERLYSHWSHGLS